MKLIFATYRVLGRQVNVQVDGGKGFEHVVLILIVEEVT